MRDINPELKGNLFFFFVEVHVSGRLKIKLCHLDEETGTLQEDSTYLNDLMPNNSPHHHFMRAVLGSSSADECGNKTGSLASVQ